MISKIDSSGIQSHLPAAERPSAGGIAHTLARVGKASLSGWATQVFLPLYWGTAGAGDAIASPPPENPELPLMVSDFYHLTSQKLGLPFKKVILNTRSE